MVLKTRDNPDQSTLTLQRQHNQSQNNGSVQWNLGTTEREVVRLKNQATKPPEDTATKEPAPQEEVSKQERRAALKARDEARKLKQEAEVELAQARKLSTTKEALLKGDLASVAKDYGMTTQEYVEHINKAALGLPAKELSAEEQKAKAE